MLLRCNLRPLIRWQVLFGVISALTLLDATTIATTGNKMLTTDTIVAVPSASTLINQTTIKPARTSSSVLTSQNQAVTTLHTKSETSTLISGVNSTTLARTSEPDKSTPSPTPAPKENVTTPSSNQTSMTYKDPQDRGTTIDTKPKSTTNPFTQSSSDATLKYSSTINSATISVKESNSQATKAPIDIACASLRKLETNIEVVCFQYPEEQSCETATKDGDLMDFLCKIINITQCQVTVYTSEVNPKCVLWAPTSKDAEETLKRREDPFFAMMKWEHVSEHVTTWRKITIALVTCGVLLAAFILAGFFLSNRESWSPGRQRLGEDPYYTETDSQGNTLVSVSAHGQDKANSGTRENGTGQTVTPVSTNGHSTKKQTVSDTEL
ncbi:hematopoietic progenitor cell antigen CD34 [Mixophyes fleayi]|uniref:hematopoietic progenitor cell antigen CD34 n=1 Tax=Mixophyes fleayi TaxID=3061075 RepID=UPI003F4DB0B5